jgi:transposase
MGTPSRTALESASETTALRRRRSIEEKRRIVEETLLPDASVARVARAHGVNANQVFRWRSQYHRGLLGGAVGRSTALLPVTVSDAVPTVRLASTNDVAPARSCPPVAAPTRPGIIHLELPNGKLRIEGAADPASLRVVLDSLLG